MHLIKSSHREIKLHENSEHGDIMMECYICGTKTIFHLGFTQVDVKNDSEDNDSTETEKSVIIICREKCLNLRKYENLEWNIEDWNIIVEEKQLADWIVKLSEPNSLN